MKFEAYNNYLKIEILIETEEKEKIKSNIINNIIFIINSFNNISYYSFNISIIIFNNNFVENFIIVYMFYVSIYLKRYIIQEI